VPKYTPDAVDRVLAHLRLPLTTEPRSDGWGAAYYVTAAPVPRWVVGTAPEPNERGPPDCRDGVDPPAPDD
jgi:hypothetical protein